HGPTSEGGAARVLGCSCQLSGRAYREARGHWAHRHRRHRHTTDRDGRGAGQRPAALGGDHLVGSRALPGGIEPDRRDNAPVAAYATFTETLSPFFRFPYTA